MQWGCWTLFLHEVVFPISYGAEDLTELFFYTMSIDLEGHLIDLKEPEQVYEGNTGGVGVIYGPSRHFLNLTSHTRVSSWSSDPLGKSPGRSRSRALL